MANLGNQEPYDQNQIELRLSDPQFNGKNITNRVLVQEIDRGFFKKQNQKQQNINQIKKKSLVYYLPTYMWIQIKNFTNINLKNLQGEINLIIHVAFSMQDVPEKLIEHIRNKFVLRFSRDEAINLGDKQLLEVNHKVVNQNRSIEQFTLRKVLKAGLVGDIIFSPFEKIYLILSVRVQDLEFPKEQIKKIFGNRDFAEAEAPFKKNQYIQDIKIIFNLMDINEKQHHFNRITFSDEGTYGDYDLAEKLLSVEYTNNEICKRIREKSQLNFQTSNPLEYSIAHFQMPLYKYPMVRMFTIFIPLWLLGVINLAIFFQDPGLADRIGNLAGLMIAFVALIPVIQEQLPPNPNLTLVQILVYFQSITTIFCFIESIIVRDSPEGFEFNWQTNGWFIASMAIQILQFVIVMFLVVQYTYRKLFVYNKFTEEQEISYFSLNSHLNWENQECDRSFRRKIDSRDIQVLKIKLNKQNREA